MKPDDSIEDEIRIKTLMDEYAIVCNTNKARAEEIENILWNEFKINLEDGEYED